MRRRRTLLLLTALALAVHAEDSSQTLSEKEAAEFRSRAGVHDFGVLATRYPSPRYVLRHGHQDQDKRCVYPSEPRPFDPQKLETMVFQSESIAEDVKGCEMLEVEGWVRRQVPASRKSGSP